MAVTFWDYVQSMLVNPTTLLNDQAAVRTLVGEVLQFILDGDRNALPNANPLSITLSPSSLSLTAGGTGEMVFVQNRLCDTCPSFTETIAANNTGSTRYDLLSIQYLQGATNTQSFPTPTGSENVSQTTEAIAYFYSTNNPSQTPPAGFVAFAVVAVPAGATLGTQCTVTYLFQTVSELLTTILGGLVTTLNGSSGAITLENGTGITITALGGGAYSINATGPANPVTSVGGVVGGAVGLAEGTGIVITVSDGTITIANSGVTSLNGQTGAQSITSSDSSITVTPNGSGAVDVKVASSQASIGACITAHATFTNPASQLPITVTLPTLPGGSSAEWYLEAFCIGIDFSGSGSGQNATMSGAGATWAGNSYIQQPAYTRTLMIVGQAAGGQTPSVTVSGNGGLEITPNSTAGYITLKAIRIS